MMIKSLRVKPISLVLNKYINYLYDIHCQLGDLAGAIVSNYA